MPKSAAAAANANSRNDDARRPHAAAKQDINDIWDYVAADNIEAASTVLDALETALAKLAKHPSIGHWRKNWPTNGTGSFWSTRT